MSAKDASELWKKTQQDPEEMRRLKERADEINTEEGRDNHRTSVSRGASIWNDFVSHYCEEAKKGNCQKKTRPELKEMWGSLTPEQKKAFKRVH